MAVTTPWRIGSPTYGYIDLPDVKIDGANVEYLEQGGDARAADGTLLFDRTGPVKRQHQLGFDDAAQSSSWSQLEQLYRQASGPWDMYDPLLPNLLSLEDRLMDGWVTAAGVSLGSPASMRLTLDGTTTAAQTAATTAPAIAGLVAVTPGQTLTASLSLLTSPTLIGTWQAFGYAATPSGSGTQMGATVALSAAGRYTLTFTVPAGIVWAELRATRTSGTGTIADPSLWPGTQDAGRSLLSVRLSGVSQKPTGIFDRSGFTCTVTEI